MILLFGEKANKSHSSHKSGNVKNNPVENSGILAYNNAKCNSLLDANEYDMYMFSQQANIDYSQYTDDGGYALSCISFMSDYSQAVSAIGTEVSTSSFGGEFGGCVSSSSSCCSCSCGSFSSVC